MKTQMKNDTCRDDIDGFILNVFADVADFRDYEYQPPLIKIKSEFNPDRKKLTILNQGQEGACTGFALGACINLLNRQRGKRYLVSQRMLYEMARRFDEWPGNDYSGSSCRGAIKGWYAMGACRDKTWPYEENAPSHLTVDAAKGARENRVGAYYRLNHRLADFHAAINETGAIFCSANVHGGWSKDAVAFNRNAIQYLNEEEQLPGHAFALVGYNDDGFIVQNSWGEAWGDKGTALWSYEDWYANLRDAWVFRLSLSSKAIWQISTRQKNVASGTELVSSTSPIRSEVAGHFVHIDDGEYHDHGAYWSNPEDVSETAKLLSTNQDKYKHLLFFAHGGLVPPKSEARRIRAYKTVMKENGIYPFHFMYDTGLFEEIGDLIKRKGTVADDRVGGISDYTDIFIEKVLRRPGRSIWREMKFGARSPFDQGKAGFDTLTRFIDALQAEGMQIKIHCAGHSTGAIFLAYLLDALEAIAPSLRVHSLSLMAPACTTGLFRSHYKPILEEKKFFGINKMAVYNLNEDLEEDDNVAKAYRKSLLYLVSRSFEEQTPAEILGMQKYSRSVDKSVGKLVDFHYSDGSNDGKQKTSAKTHGGFDNDATTLNSILRMILGKKPDHPFKPEDVKF